MKMIPKSKRNSHLYFNTNRRSLLKCKRSQSHVEMILSFMIFIGFITAMFIFFNPLQQTKVRTTFLDVTENRLIENLSIEYQTIPLFLDDHVVRDICINIDKIDTDKSNILVKDIEGNELASSMGTSKIYIDTMGNDFHRIYFSDHFIGEKAPPTTGSCEGSDEKDLTIKDDYTLGILNTKNAVFMGNIKDFIKAYTKENNYEKVKEELDITNDFEIRVYNKTDELMFEASIYKPVTIDVVARNIPVLAIDRNGNPVDLTINIRAW